MSQNAAQVRMFLCYMNPIQSILLLYINATSKCACEIYLEEFGMFSKIHMKFSIFPCELAWSLVLGCLNTGTNGEGKSTGKLTNPGSHGKWLLQSCVCVTITNYKNMWGGCYSKLHTKIKTGDMHHTQEN